MWSWPEHVAERAAVADVAVGEVERRDSRVRREGLDHPRLSSSVASHAIEPESE